MHAQKRLTLRFLALALALAPQPCRAGHGALLGREVALGAQRRGACAERPPRQRLLSVENQVRLSVENKVRLSVENKVRLSVENQVRLSVENQVRLSVERGALEAAVEVRTVRQLVPAAPRRLHPGGHHLLATMQVHVLAHTVAAEVELTQREGGGLGGIQQSLRPLPAADRPQPVVADRATADGPTHTRTHARTRRQVSWLMIASLARVLAVHGVYAWIIIMCRLT
jgi:hypothetical protein